MRYFFCAPVDGFAMLICDVCGPPSVSPLPARPFPVPSRPPALAAPARQLQTRPGRTGSNPEPPEPPGLQPCPPPDPSREPAVKELLECRS